MVGVGSLAHAYIHGGRGAGRGGGHGRHRARGRGQRSAGQGQQQGEGGEEVLHSHKVGGEAQGWTTLQYHLSDRVKNRYLYAITLPEPGNEAQCG